MTEDKLKEALARVRYEPNSGHFYWVRSKKPALNGRRAEIVRKADKYNQIEYADIQVGELKIRAHRLAFYFMTGKLPKHCVDHINGDTLDNSWNNLRDVTRAVNARNRRLDSRNKTGVPGISYLTARNRYLATAGRSRLAYTPDFFEACCARKSAENRLGYHPNNGRDI